MSTPELKAQLVALIEQEEDVEKLEVIRNILNSPEQKIAEWEISAMRQRTKESEDDFAAGRVHTADEARSRISQFWANR